MGNEKGSPKTVYFSPEELDRLDSALGAWEKRFGRTGQSAFLRHMVFAGLAAWEGGEASPTRADRTSDEARIRNLPPEESARLWDAIDRGTAKRTPDDLAEELLAQIATEPGILRARLDAVRAEWGKRGHGIDLSPAEFVRRVLLFGSWAAAGELWPGIATDRERLAAAAVAVERWHAEHPGAAGTPEQLARWRPVGTSRPPEDVAREEVRLPAGELDRLNLLRAKVDELRGERDAIGDADFVRGLLRRGATAWAREIEPFFDGEVLGPDWGAWRTSPTPDAGKETGPDPRDPDESQLRALLSPLGIDRWEVRDGTLWITALRPDVLQGITVGAVRFVLGPDWRVELALDPVAPPSGTIKGKVADEKLHDAQARARVADMAARAARDVSRSWADRALAAEGRAVDLAGAVGEALRSAGVLTVQALEEAAEKVRPSWETDGNDLQAGAPAPSMNLKNWAPASIWALARTMAPTLQALADSVGAAASVTAPRVREILSLCQRLNARCGGGDGVPIEIFPPSAAAEREIRETIDRLGIGVVFRVWPAPSKLHDVTPGDPEPQQASAIADATSGSRDPAEPVPATWIGKGWQGDAPEGRSLPHPDPVRRLASSPEDLVDAWQVSDAARERIEAEIRELPAEEAERVRAAIADAMRRRASSSTPATTQAPPVAPGSPEAALSAAADLPAEAVAEAAAYARKRGRPTDAQRAKRITDAAAKLGLEVAINLRSSSGPTVYVRVGSDEGIATLTRELRRVAQVVDQRPSDRRPEGGSPPILDPKSAS